MNRILATIATCALPVTASAVSLNGFTDLLVFGDSLSDADVPGLPLALFPEGQVTNGQNWAAQLGADAESGTNFAQSGATAAVSDDGVDDFAAQIDSYVADNPDLGSNPLVAVWFGGNDVATALTADDPTARVTEGVTAIAAGMQRLIGLGFDDFLLFGVPDVGDTPRLLQTAAFLSMGNPLVEQGIIAGATEATRGFNGGLSATIAALSPLANIAFVDSFALGQEVTSDPASFGFTNAEDACLTFVPGTSDIASFCGAEADTYFYYDNFHPTERAHALVAGAARDAAATLAPVPLPATAWLLGFAALGLGAARRRS